MQALDGNEGAPLCYAHEPEQNSQASANLRRFSVPGIGTGSGAPRGTSRGLALGPRPVWRVEASIQAEAWAVV